MPRTGHALAWRLLLLLVTVDVVLLSLFLRWAYVHHHGIEHSVFFDAWRFSTVDGSFIEIWGYLKQAAICVAAAMVYAQTRERFYGAFALLFTSVLADDMLRLHEWLGGTLSHPDLLGEWGIVPAAALISGLPFLIALGALIWMPTGERKPAIALMLGFALLAFFAVPVDLLHELVLGQEASGQTLVTLIEDGGELVSITAIFALWFLAADTPMLRRVDLFSRFRRTGSAWRSTDGANAAHPSLTRSISAPTADSFSSSRS